MCFLLYVISCAVENDKIDMQVSRVNRPFLFHKSEQKVDETLYE